MDARQRKAIALQIKRWFENFVQATVLGKEYILPFVAVYHSTYRCNANCAFCSRAEDIIANNGSGVVSLDRIETIFRATKELTSTLYITGGEPTIDKRIGEILKLARKVGFFPVCINTNAILLDKRPEVPLYADKIVVSLHAGKPSEHADVLKVSHKQGERVFENIIQTAKIAKSCGNNLSINCVLTNDNIREAWGVLEFCLEHQIPMAVVPAIENYMPAIASESADKIRAYRDFIDEVIRVKTRQPGAIVGTKAFLFSIRDFSTFQCRPAGIVTISPNGRVVNPCAYKYLAVQKTLGMAGGESLESQLRCRLDFACKFRDCNANCLKLCYFEPARFLQNPLSTLSDYLS